MLELNEVFLTQDIYEASILNISTGVSLCKVQDDGNGTVWFSFSPKEKCEGICESYHKGDLVLSAKKLFSSMTFIKDALFSEKRRTALNRK